MHRTRKPPNRRTRRAQRALWVAHHVLRHIRTYRMITTTTLVRDPDNGMPLRNEAGRVHLHRHRARARAPIAWHFKLMRWGLEHDADHVDHWYWDTSSACGCHLDYECPECLGHACACATLAGPGLKGMTHG